MRTSSESIDITNDKKSNEDLIKERFKKKTQFKLQFSQMISNRDPKHTVQCASETKEKFRGKNYYSQSNFTCGGHSLKFSRNFKNNSINFFHSNQQPSSSMFRFLNTNQRLARCNILESVWREKQIEERNKENKKIFCLLGKQQKKLQKRNKDQWNFPKLKQQHIKNSTEGEEVEFYGRVLSPKQIIEDDIRKSFNLHILNPICLDGTFPKGRLNAKLITSQDRQSKEQELFLIGGMSSDLGKKLPFHNLDQSNLKWVKIDSNLPHSPQFNISQHALVEHRRRIFIIGGISVFYSHKEQKNQRINNQFIFSFNLDKKIWIQTNWNISLRGHTAACNEKYAFIYGGIRENGSFNEKIFVLDMEKSQSPTPIANTGLALAFHQTVSTQDIDEKQRNFLAVKGMLCFGGKLESDQINGKMFYMEVDSKFIEFYDRFHKFEWNVLKCFGQPPAPRFNHTMNILNTKSQTLERKAFCVIIGGMTNGEIILSDVWLLDLFNLNWIQVTLSSQSNLPLEKGIMGHCVQTTQNHIYIFGGCNRERKQSSYFWEIEYDQLQAKVLLGISSKNRSKANSKNNSEKFIYTNSAQCFKR